MPNDGVLRLDGVEPRALRDEVTRVLEEGMLLGRLSPGQRLIETEIASQLGISRAPVREAFSQLQQRGLIEIVPNQGATVIDPSEEEICQAVAVRIHLETLAVRLAAARDDEMELSRADQAGREIQALVSTDFSFDWDVVNAKLRIYRLEARFHTHLVRAAGSPFLTRLWSMVASYLWVAMYMRQQATGGQDGDLYVQRMFETIGEHREILEAVRLKDMDLAASAVRKHLLPGYPELCLDKKVMAALRWPLEGGSGEERG